MPNYTTLPLEACKNRSLFLKYAKNVGRAYQNQALELISMCQLLLRISSPKCVHEEAEQRRIFGVCDIALRSAADSGTKVTDEANARFEEATQVLSSHSVRRLRLDLPITFYSRMEIAKRKDSVEGGWSRVVKRATLFLQKTTRNDERRPTMTIHFVLLRSPLLSLHDPGNVIVSQELSTDTSFPEILWNFSRYRGRARIALEQNPHFYLRCPVDESAFTPTFRCYPLKDPSGALEHNDTVYVLFDGPGRVYLDTENKLRSFGNVWLLNGSLIFRDSSGVLEGEQLVRGSSIRGELWHCEQKVVLHNSESRSQSIHRCLRPIITTFSAGRSAGGIVQDRTALNRLASRSVDVHIYGSSLPGSINSLDETPPPLPPTSGQPGYHVLYTTSNALNDDVLLYIFNYYRWDDEISWNIRLGWSKLSRVCRRWRHLVYSSAFYLGMHILCTNGTPTVNTLDHLPPIPLFVDYWYATSTISEQDKRGIVHALRLHDRVRCIDLHLPSSFLHSLLLRHVNAPFPMLEHLSLSSTTEEDTGLVLSTYFLAPNLCHLTLLGVGLPRKLPLLSSAISLSTLTLTNIRASGYIFPRELVACLQTLPQLEDLSISFSIPMPRPSTQSNLLGKLVGNPVTLPNLKYLTFQGVSAYLDCLVAQIRAPLLARLIITLFNQIAFTLPHLSHFTHTTEGLKHPNAKIVFWPDEVSIIMVHDGTRQHDSDGHFVLRVLCNDLDWQIDCAAQICSALMPGALCGVRKLRLDFDGEMMPTEWQDGEIDDTTWHDLLMPFILVRDLRICGALTQELSRALQVDEIGLDPGLLPDLQKLAYRHGVGDLFSSFLDARRVAGRPVHVLPTLLSTLYPLEIPTSWVPGPLAPTSHVPTRTWI